VNRLPRTRPIASAPRAAQLSRLPTTSRGSVKQVAIPPAILRAPMLAITHRFPAHTHFLQHANRSAVVDVDGGYHPFGAQLEKTRHRSRASAISVRVIPLPPLLGAEHVAQVHDLRLDQGQIAGGRSGRAVAIFPSHPPVQSARSRHFHAVKPSSSSKVFRPCCLRRAARRKDSG